MQPTEQCVLLYLHSSINWLQLLSLTCPVPSC